MNQPAGCVKGSGPGGGSGRTGGGQIMSGPRISTGGPSTSPGALGGGGTDTAGGGAGTTGSGGLGGGGPCAALTPTQLTHAARTSQPRRDMGRTSLGRLLPAGTSGADC